MDGSPEPDFAKQVQLAFDNLGAVLEAAGCGMKDIVDVTSFHTDPEKQLDTMMQFKSRIFPEALYPKLGCGWCDLAGGVRFRDQGHCPLPYSIGQSVSSKKPSAGRGDRLRSLRYTMARCTVVTPDIRLAHLP